MASGVIKHIENFMGQSITLTGTSDVPIKMYETGDEDFKAIAVYDKNNVQRYRLIFNSGHLYFYSYDASGQEITHKELV